MMRIAVIVLTYNGRQYLPDLFASLAVTKYTEPWTLFVVDNASTDGTADAVGKFEIRNSKFEIIRNAKNLGFAAGNNIGIRKALDDGAEYVVLLNQDTVVEPDWLTQLIEAAEQDQKIGAVQARLMLWDKKDIANSLGNEIHFLGFGYSGGYRQRFEISKYRNIETCEITYASGAAVLYRASALNDVGVFDESFWMYHDDLDMGWRFWRAGWKSVLAPYAVVYHKYEFSRSIKKYYYMERNRFLVLFENYSFLALVSIFPALLVMEIGMFPFTIFSGWWKEKLRVYMYFFRWSTWRMIHAQRRAKHKIFRSREHEFIRRFVGTIAFQDMQSPLLQYIANPLFNFYWQIMKHII